MTDIELRHLSELRALLEGFGARHAALQASHQPERLQHLVHQVSKLTLATQQHDYAAFRHADQLLHVGIMELAAVPELLPAWQLVWNRLQHFHQQAFEECFPDARFLSDEHEYLVRTITTGDPAAAEDAARSHVEAVWFRLAEAQSNPSQGTPLQRAVAHLAFSLARPLRLEQVAQDVAFTSAGNLSRLFRKTYGMSFQAYLQKIRLEKAADLLHQTRLPVSLIARRIGYRDVSRFGQHFKRRYGHTPAAFRGEGR